MKPRLHVVFSGGGTGGHLFPGLAVACEMQAAVDVRITFAGCGAEIESREVAAAGFEYIAIPCRPLSHSPRAAWRFIRDHFRGVRSARRFVRDQRVSVVVGLGGFASVPMARAALAEQIPLVLLEQNAIPGRATRWLAPRAALVCAAFSETGEQLTSSGSICLTGNPVRAAFVARGTASREVNNSGPRQLLVCGGSGGAKVLNEHVPRALYKMGPMAAGWRVVHQAGPRGAAATATLYEKLGIAADVVAFLDDMPHAMRASDLAVCRAGGTTLAELAACGLPAVLVPYPHAVGDHQRKNADVFASLGACSVVDERDVPGRLDDALAAEFSRLLADDALRRLMSAAIGRAARPDAAGRIARMVRELAIAGASAHVTKPGLHSRPLGVRNC